MRCDLSSHEVIARLLLALIAPPHRIVDYRCFSFCSLHPLTYADLVFSSETHFRSDSLPLRFVATASTLGSLSYLSAEGYSKFADARREKQDKQRSLILRRGLFGFPKRPSRKGLVASRLEVLPKMLELE